MSKTKKKKSSKSHSVAEPSIPNFDANAEMPPEGGGLGYSNKPEDIIWCGENMDLDPDDWVNDHIGRRHPLEHVLTAIITAHPCDGGSDEVRLEAALNALVNWQKTPGRKPKSWETLKEIARQYWTKYADGDHDPELQEIILSVVPDIDPTKSKEIQRWRDAFNDRKDALLFSVTGQSDHAQVSRRFTEYQICDLLKRLGVKTDKVQVT